MRLRSSSWVVALSLVAAACAAAIPSAERLTVAGGVRFSAPGATLLVAAGGGLPVFATRPGEVCAGSALGPLPSGQGIDLVAGLPEVELAMDCVEFDGSVVYPVWSPDATRVAFMGVRAGASHIWMFDIVDVTVTDVTASPADDTRPLWVDDRTVVFVRTLGDATDWYRVDVLEGDPEPVAAVPGSVDLDGASRVVHGDEPYVVFPMVDPDGAPAGIHSVPVAGGVVDPLFEPDAELVAAGFRVVDIRDDGAAALVAVGPVGLEDPGADVYLADLDDGSQRYIGPVFGSSIGDIRFSGDRIRLVGWERDTDRGDAVVVRTAGSDDDAEALLFGDIGTLTPVTGGVAYEASPDLVLVLIDG